MKKLFVSVLVFAMFAVLTFSTVSAATYQVDAEAVFTSGKNYIDIIQVGNNSQYLRSFAVSNYTTAQVGNRTYYQSSYPCWRESYGSGHNVWGQGYAHLTATLDVPDVVLSDLNGGKVNSVEIYFYMYIEVTSNKYPMTGVNAKLENSDGSEIFLNVETLVDTFVYDTYGVEQNVFRVTLPSGTDFKYYADTEIVFIRDWLGLPQKGGYLTFGLSPFSTIDITPISVGENQQIQDNKDDISSIGGDLGSAGDSLNVSKPNGGTVDNIGSNLGLGGISELDDVVNVFDRLEATSLGTLLTTLLLTSISIAFIGYALHGKR